jgi:hypothetical protein
MPLSDEEAFVALEQACERVLRKRDEPIYLGTEDPCLRMARLGDVDSMYKVGHHYLTGFWWQYPHATTAQYWLFRAYDAGSKQAPYDLGKMYEEGLGVPVDFTRALHWYQVAALGNHNDYWAVTVGRWHREGKGTPVNAQEALKWFEQAIIWDTECEEGHLELGQCHQQELGTPMNLTLARWHYVQASYEKPWSPLTQLQAIDASRPRQAFLDLQGTPEETKLALQAFLQQAGFTAQARTSDSWATVPEHAVVLLCCTGPDGALTVEHFLEQASLRHAALCMVLCETSGPFITLQTPPPIPGGLVLQHRYCTASDGAALLLAFLACAEQPGREANVVFTKAMRTLQNTAKETQVESTTVDNLYE